MKDDRAQQRLRLLQVLEPSGGGSGRHFVDLCQGLQARGHAVTAVYSPVRAEARFVAELDGSALAATIAVPMRRAVGPWDATALAAVHRIIRDNGPFDIIHGHSSKAGALTRLRLPGRHVPRIYTPHAFRTMDPHLGRGARLVYGSVEILLGRLLSDRIICVSKDEYSHALSFGIAAAKKLRVVINGVKTPPNDRRAILRAAMELPSNALVFGFVGRLSRQKAPERLVAAFAEIAAKMPHAYLLMIGSGELELELKARIDASGLAARVRLRSDLPGSDAIQCFDILVSPSRYEAMSYVMLEAAAAGKPMILSDVGGVSTVLDDGVNGIRVPNCDDPAALAEAMLAFADADRRQRFAAAAMQRCHGYQLDQMVEQTLQVYRDTLLEHSGSTATKRQ
ncbi:MAG: glycosyltransferase family 4 protein [Allorhizobium sp.]